MEVGGKDDGDVLNKDYFHVEGLKFVAIKSPKADVRTQEQVDYIRITYLKQISPYVLVRTLENISILIPLLIGLSFMSFTIIQTQVSEEAAL